MTNQPDDDEIEEDYLVMLDFPELHSMNAEATFQSIDLKNIESVEPTVILDGRFPLRGYHTAPVGTNLFFQVAEKEVSRADVAGLRLVLKAADTVPEVASSTAQFATIDVVGSSTKTIVMELALPKNESELVLPNALISELQSITPTN